METERGCEREVAAHPEAQADRILLLHQEESHWRKQGGDTTQSQSIRAEHIKVASKDKHHLIYQNNPGGKEGKSIMQQPSVGLKRYPLKILL